MKLHEITQPNLDKQLHDLDIRDYTINDDGSVDAVSVSLGFKNCPGGKIPVKFNKISGYFDVDYCNLTSLENFPVEVTGAATVRENNFTNLKGLRLKKAKSLLLERCKNLTSLEGLDPNFQGSISVSGCPVTSLEYLPKHITGYLDISDTKITSFVGITDIISKIDGEFYFDPEKIKEGGLGLVAMEINMVSFMNNTTEMPAPWKIIRTYLGTDNIIECQSELIEAGFEEYAVL